MKQHLDANPARSLAQLQARLDVFTAYYNDVRPLPRQPPDDTTSRPRRADQGPTIGLTHP
jgi:hypothetical protein